MTAPSPIDEPAPTGAQLNVRQAAFIGVGAMVGAGIFSLLGAAGEVAGAAVWISFLLAGTVAMLQGYSFAKFGSRYPSAGGMLEYVRQGFGDGHITGVIAWLLLGANAIITGMVAVSFGSYASSAATDGDETWAKVFAVGVVVVMTALNVVGSRAVARVADTRGGGGDRHSQHLRRVDTGEPRPRSPRAVELSIGRRHHRQHRAHVLRVPRASASITFTAKDLVDPAHQLPRAMYLALGIATVIYVAVALGVFGTLTVDEVIDSGGTALAVAAEPTLGRAGYWMMTVTALFATSGATNAGLYPAKGLCEEMTETRQFPPVMGSLVAGRAAFGLVATAVASSLLAVFFDLSAIASIGSVIALVVFTLDHRRPHARACGNGSEHRRVGDRRVHDRRGARRVRVHESRRRTGDGRDPRRDHRRQHRHRRMVEAPP